MINYFHQRLGMKLFLSYLAVILIGALVLGIATKFTVQTAFNRHLGMMTQAGFEKCSYHNLSGGIVALHRGYRL